MRQLGNGMTEKIIEVHSISSAAAGWKRAKDGTPVACFALVTVACPDSLGVTEKAVVPLFSHDLMVGLVGRVVEMIDDAVEFEAMSD